jgi:hypothetical protein
MNLPPLSTSIKKARAITYVASNNPDAFTTAQLIQIIKYANQTLHTTWEVFFAEKLPATPDEVRAELAIAIPKEISLFEKELRKMLLDD